MLNFLKRNNNSVEEVAEQMEKTIARVENIEAEIGDLTEKRRKAILNGKRVAKIDDRIKRLRQEADDITEILLPDLNEKFDSAKADAAEQERREKIKEVLANDEELYAEISERMAAVRRHRQGYVQNLARLKEIKEQHANNMTKLNELKGQRAPLDWNILENFLRRIG